jgi:hypothetical protein
VVVELGSHDTGGGGRKWKIVMEVEKNHTQSVYITSIINGMAMLELVV